jgi:hypothetical protein
MKCWWVEWLSWSQKGNYFTVLEGWINFPFSITGERQGRDLFLGVRQFMRSVWGIENVRLSDFALLEMTLNIRCSMHIFVR